MAGIYLVFGVAVVLTILLGSLKLIRGNGVGDYLVTFIGLVIAGLAVLVIYRKFISHEGEQR
jgi:hypothetical protein